MNSTIAASLAIALQVSIIILVVYGLQSKGPGGRGALAVVFAGMGLLVAQFGFFTGGKIPATPISLTASNAKEARQACRDVAAKLREFRVIEEERADGTIFVKAAMWNQIPAQVREGIEVCLNELAPEGEGKIIAR